MSPTRYPFDMKTSGYSKMWRRNYDITTTLNFMYWHLSGVASFLFLTITKNNINVDFDWPRLLHFIAGKLLVAVETNFLPCKTFWKQINYLQEEISEKKNFISLQNISNEFKHWSPKGQVPFIELNGRTFSDSNDIIDHLKKELKVLMRIGEPIYQIMVSRIPISV